MTSISNQISLGNYISYLFPNKFENVNFRDYKEKISRFVLCKLLDILLLTNKNFYTAVKH